MVGAGCVGAGSDGEAQAPTTNASAAVAKMKTRKLNQSPLSGGSHETPVIIQEEAPDCDRGLILLSSCFFDLLHRIRIDQ